MQKKTIKKNIEAKLSAWIKTIQNPDLQNAIKKDVVVSGGAICSMLLNEPVNDYDVYFKTETTARAVADYYGQPYESVLEIVNYSRRDEMFRRPEEDGTLHGIRKAIYENLKPGQVKILMPTTPSGFKTNFVDEEKGEYQALFFSPNAISLSDKLQIVLRFTGTVEEIHKSFDFVHATNYFTFEEGVVTNLKAVESILSKQLYYQGSLYPLTTVIRMKKFIKRGWNVSAGEMLKAMFQISQLDLTDVNVLEDQLIGVDVAYFGILINALKAKQQSDANFIPEYSYLAEIIDRIFND